MLDFLFIAFTFEWWKCYFSLYKETPLFENVINIRKNISYQRYTKNAVLIHRYIEQVCECMIVVNDYIYIYNPKWKS